jgi:predicted ATP-grasp superfamily ATP-dependent carboligase
MGQHVLLTQGLLPSTLAIARSLRAAGHRVSLGDPDGTVIARFSRHVGRFFPLPLPARDPVRFRDAVLTAAARARAGVVLPTFEEGLVLAALWPSAAPRLAAPPFELALSLADKGTGVAAAARAGLPAATTLPATEPAGSLARDLGFPLVVKPRFATSGVGVRVARDAGELSRILDALAAPADHVAQRWAGDRELVFQGVFDAGRCVAAHAYRVVCRHPPQHGFGILLESVTDERVLAHGIRLGEAVGYDGPLGVDFLAGDGGEPRAVEVNPRFVLGVVNAVDAGVPIPARAAELHDVRHETVTAARPGYAAGVRSLHWPSVEVTRATGEPIGAQLAGWAARQARDPGALSAFMAQVVLHRLRGGFDTVGLEGRTLTAPLARRLRAEQARAR